MFITEIKISSLQSNNYIYFFFSQFIESRKVIFLKETEGELNDTTTLNNSIWKEDWVYLDKFALLYIQIDQILQRL